MKTKKNLVLRQLVGTWVVLPLASSTVNFNELLSLNETGCLLWRRLEEGSTREELATALTEEYEVTREQALADVDAFLLKLEGAGYVEA